MNKIERIFCSGLHNLEVGVVYRNLKVVCNLLNDRGRNSCEKKLMSVVVKCKDIGMNREKVEDMINKVIDGVFGEE